MVEFARFAQTKALEENGWTQDDECRRLQWADESVGGPTYMRDPNGLYYAVGCGKETPLDGMYQRWCLSIPKDCPDQRSIAAGQPFTTRTVVYRDGRVRGHQG